MERGTGFASALHRAKNHSGFCAIEAFSAELCRRPNGIVYGNTAIQSISTRILIKPV